MKHYIDPTIDFVFKLLFGVVENIPLLLDFLNKTLQPIVPIISITLENPYDEREYEKDKLSIIDVQAKDGNGITYQIEIQLDSPKHLTNRMLYNWGGLYHGQLEKSEKYDKLKPVICIWILTRNLIKHSPAYHHICEVWDRKNDIFQGPFIFQSWPCCWSFGSLARHSESLIVILFKRAVTQLAGKMTT
ncbi:MAG: Rpn family recombination-promoting nuclease/putative transposase, partial [Algicola sp.]|nr:Rpn family recombination-promoting nuclease/putative transposase [Algicola sp.]